MEVVVVVKSIGENVGVGSGGEGGSGGNSGGGSGHGGRGLAYTSVATDGIPSNTGELHPVASSALLLSMGASAPPRLLSL